MNDNEAKIWKCACCSFVGFRDELKRVVFEVGPGDVCPSCNSEDIFPALDGEWPKPDELIASKRWDYDYEDD